LDLVGAFRRSVFHSVQPCSLVICWIILFTGKKGNIFEKWTSTQRIHKWTIYIQLSLLYHSSCYHNCRSFWFRLEFIKICSSKISKICLVTLLVYVPNSCSNPNIQHYERSSQTYHKRTKNGYACSCIRFVPNSSTYDDLC
jgi:hypothetical protein